MVDGFTIEGVLGRGAHSQVYLARQERPARRVALKVLLTAFPSPDSLYRFEREAALMGSIEHPNIARLYGSGFYRSANFEHPYLVMERVEGQPLTDYADHARLDLRARLTLLATLAEAVHFVHTHGVIHRDLKPANILVDGQGAPRILDFGVARAAEGETAAWSLTQTGDRVGTLPYMAPEQLAGDPGSGGPQVDVYALGVVGYQLVAGSLPYHAEAFRTVITAAETLKRFPPQQQLQRLAIPADARNVLAKAMHDDRAGRYASALEFALDLRRFLGSEPVTARPPRLWHALRLFVRRRAAWSAAIAFSALSLVAAAGLSTRFALTEAAALRQTQQQADQLRGAYAFLTRVLTELGPNHHHGDDLTLREVLRTAARQVGQELEANPELGIRTGLVIANGLIETGDVDRANQLIEAANRVARAQPGLAPEVLREAALGDAIRLETAGRYAESAAVLEPLLQAPRGQTTDSIEQWGNLRLEYLVCLQELGKLRAAQAMLEETERGVADVPAARARLAGTLLNKRLSISYSLGQFRQLLALEQSDGERLRVTLGENDAGWHNLLAKASASARELGDYRRALALALRLQAVVARIYGPSSQHARYVDGAVAYVQHLQDPAAPAPVQTLETLYHQWQGLQGAETAYVLEARINLDAARLAGPAGPVRAAAEQDLRSLWADVARGSAPGDARTTRARLMLAQWVRRQGRVAESAALYTELCQDLRQRLDADHPYLQRCRQEAAGHAVEPPQT